MVSVRASFIVFAFVLAGQGFADTSPFIAGFDRFAVEQTESDGRLLLSELSCTACHTSTDPTAQPKRGPNLEGAGRRLQVDWLRRFIAAPQQTKPGTTMPDLLAGWESDRKTVAIEALVSFLVSQQQPFAELESTSSNPIAQRFWSKGDRLRGQARYHQIGCVACHEPDPDYQTTGQQRSRLDRLGSQLDAEELRDLGIGDPSPTVHSVPHPKLGDKYSRRSLTHFLLDPLATRPSGRMPDLKLTPTEAADISAYLLPDRTADDHSIDVTMSADSIAAGRKLFSELGCGNCHRVAGSSSDTSSDTSSAKSTIDLAHLNFAATSSCIGEPRPEMPHYKLDAAQLSALNSALESPQVVDVVDFRMRQLNCYACHQRGGRGGVGPQRQRFFETVGHVDLGDEGRLPPPLDGVGSKLTSKGFKTVFSGSGDVRPT